MSAMHKNKSMEISTNKIVCRSIVMMNVMIVASGIRLARPGWRVN